MTNMKNDTNDTNETNETNDKTLLNKAILWTAHKIGVSGLILFACIFEIARLANSLSAGQHTESYAYIAAVGLWVSLKFLAPLVSLLPANVNTWLQGGEGHDQLSSLDRTILWIVHSVGLSGLIVVFGEFQIARLSTSVSAGEGTDVKASFLLIALWVWCKLGAPAYFRFVWPVVKRLLPKGIF
jgi:hypothetical protein